MNESQKPVAKKNYSFDWFVRGILTKFGDIFDRLLGRGWKPSSSLATSELIERLKALLDLEARKSENHRVFVPHNIKLKMQWDKFSTDADASLKKLETELLTAAIDHINDNRYHTYAPLKLEIKPDYFTDGVKLLAGFDKFVEEDAGVEVNVTVPDLKNIVPAAKDEKIFEDKKTIESNQEIFSAEFNINGRPIYQKLIFNDGKRISVGRTRENDLSLDDPSVSKIHAALILNSQKTMLVSDTGSTNGTFIGGQRIAYGKAVPINDGEKVKFGTVEVLFNRVSQDLDADASDNGENLLTVKDFSDIENEFERKGQVIINSENKI